MTRGRIAALTVVAVATVAVLGLVGLLLGDAKAPTAADGRATQRESAAEGERIAERAARKRAHTRGYRVGVSRGRQRGERSGGRRGIRVADRKQEVIAAQAQAAEQRRQQEAAEAEKAERAENCGAPLFVDGYCPTDEEIERESDAESLCGPGTEEGRNQAADKGIGCFPPGDPRNP